MDLKKAKIRETFLINLSNTSLFTFVQFAEEFYTEVGENRPRQSVL